ncbi:MAG: hypothetical protein BGO31_18875 [Bacteroidetes bacterium 43-16]|nr:MAG: hypothetical protein BGO31_18875 [Bacteroidetes bacterium 43-16]
MGIVRKQSILSLISIYSGFAIGALNQYLYIHFLSQEQYGLTTLLREIFLALSTFANLGTVLTFHRFYPMYQHFLGKKRNDLPFIVIGASIIGLTLVVASLFIFKDLIIRKFSENSPLFVEWFYLLVPLTVTFLCMLLFEAFAFMLKRTVGANLIKETGFRLFQSAIIMLYCFKWISIDTFFILFSLMYVPSVIIMGAMVFTKNGIQINYKISGLTKRIYKSIASYTAFHFSGVAIAVLPIAINMSIITSISKNGLIDTAVYGLARFFVSIIEAPLRSMLGINIATVSEATHQKDKEKISRIYKKTSITLFITGLALFILIATNIDLVNATLFNKNGKDYSMLGAIFFIIGLAKVFELSMGLNNVILYMSKYWKVEFYITSSVILLNIPVSYLLTKHWGVMGTACSDAIMLSLFCLLRFYFVKRLIGIQPYTSKTLGMLLIGIACFIITAMVPSSFPVIISLALKATVFMLLYFTAIWFYNPSEDMKDILTKMFQKILKK